MTQSPTANFLSEAIENSPLTQRELADRSGFKSPNIHPMLKFGETRVAGSHPGIGAGLGD
ncbi:hypothetical protein [Ruegeria marisrubri]|uniref:hypothetical protein n=1 Tax=Ruegeria marisrubri TaxID=1685379 RepID=UPI000A902FFF|nr:hypothetical protein [Ruegeria marisrubri]